MVSRRLGSQGPEISTVGLGTWAMSGSYQFGWGAADDEESVAAIRYAVESGVTWVDTAAIYGFGRSEEVVGRGLEPFRAGEDVLVFTKCGRVHREAPNGTDIGYDLRPESIRRECEESLRRLGVERIDLYQFHWPDFGTGIPVEESWGTMAELADEGKVRWIGVSNFPVPLLERCERIRHVDSVQPPLSLLNRHAREEVVPWARANGTGVIAYSPMASGLLTGGFSFDRVAEDDWRRRAPSFQEPKLSQALALVEQLRPIAERLGLSLPELAVAWVLAVPGVTGAIVGARRPSQVDSWLAAGDAELPSDVVDEIEHAIAETGAGTAEATLPPGISAERAAEMLGLGAAEEER
jgi:aryl-alcohol dehydrogenase-like predicted oxidoreductase